MFAKITRSAILSERSLYDRTAIYMDCPFHGILRFTGWTERLLRYPT